MDKRPCEHSDLLLLCLTGDATDREQARTREHLVHCEECRGEWRELLDVWHALPFALEEVEVPAELKRQVMHAAVAASAGQAPDASLSASRSGSKTALQPGSRFILWWSGARLTVYRIAIAVLGVLLAASWWQYRALQRELVAITRPADQPAQVVHVYPLVSFDPATAAAKGRVLVLRQGGQDVLVIEVQDMRATRGSEAYQAWLIRDGQRTNAGVFVVDGQGNGVLTYVPHGEPITFDAVGITLEPDARGQQPRGKKVLGTPM